MTIVYRQDEERLFGNYEKMKITPESLTANGWQPSERFTHELTKQAGKATIKIQFPAFLGRAVVDLEIGGYAVPVQVETLEELGLLLKWLGAEKSWNS